MSKQENNYTDSDYPKAVTVEQVLDVLTKMKYSESEGLDRELFCRVFYRLEPHQDIIYMDEKWGAYQRNGIEWSWSSLDDKHRQWVCNYIEGQVYGNL